MERNGTDWVKAQYPDVFASDNWQRVQDAMRAWGWIGAVAISAAPRSAAPARGVRSADRGGQVGDAQCGVLWEAD